MLVPVCNLATTTAQPVASREEAVQKSGIDLAAIPAYRTFYAQAHGQQLVVASPQQPAPQAAQDAAKADVERRQREFLAALSSGGGATQATFFGARSGNVAVYSEISGRNALVVLSCDTRSSVRVSAELTDSWNASIPWINNMNIGVTVSKAQFVFFRPGGQLPWGTGCFPDATFTMKPVASREEAVQKAGVDLAAIAEYKTYYAQAYGQPFPVAQVQPGALASQSRAEGDSIVQLQALLDRFADDGSKARRTFFGFNIGAGAIYAEIVNDKAFVFRVCSGVTTVLLNSAFAESWDVNFPAVGNAQYASRGTLRRDGFGVFLPGQGVGPCTFAGTARPVATRGEALAVAKLDLVKSPEYASFLAQAYGPRNSATTAVSQVPAIAPLVTAQAAQAATAKLEEERRQREAQLKTEEERRLKEALAKAEQDRVQREAQLKADTDRRIKEALAKAEEERRQREAQAKVEEDRRIKEALAKADEDRRQKEALAKADEERRVKDALAKAEEERRQKEALARVEQDRRQKEALARAEDERRQKEALARADDERRQKEALAKAEDERRQKAALATAEAQRTQKESPEVSAMAAEIARLRQQLAKAESGSGAASGTRKALIIGNDNYKSVARLQNAVEDARALAEALSNVGYLVSLKTDLSEKDMKAALRIFKGQVNAGDEVAIFYAGHGVQLGSTNYLLPTDVGGDSEEQVRDEAVPLQRILDDMSEKRVKFTLAMIDACRDNPFKTSGRSIGGGTRGLAPTSAATGQMVVFAAGTGQQALDKLGANDRSKNGLFTRVMLQEMKKTGVTIDRIVKTVRTEVARLAQSVGHEQVPAIYDQVLGDFYFVK